MVAPLYAKESRKFKAMAYILLFLPPFLTDQVESGGMCYTFNSTFEGIFTAARQTCQEYGAWPATFKMMNPEQLNAVYDAFATDYG